MKLFPFFRSLPPFKGKMRIGSILFKKTMSSTNPVTFNGKFKIRYQIPNTIDSVGRELCLNGIYERETINILKKHLNQSSVFFDVGANIGSICLPIAKLTGASVHAFEPSDFVFNFLQENVLNNNLPNITLNKVAVYSQHHVTLNFFATDQKYGGSSLSPTYNQHSYEVNSISLDEYCKEKGIDKIDALKIDVQGFEIAVLKGASVLLQKKAIAFIIFEMESWAEKEAGYPAGSSQQFLIDNGYELFNMNNDKLGNVQTTGTYMFLAKPVYF